MDPPRRLNQSWQRPKLIAVRMPREVKRALRGASDYEKAEVRAWFRAGAPKAWAVLWAQLDSEDQRIAQNAAMYCLNQAIGPPGKGFDNVEDLEANREYCEAVTRENIFSQLESARAGAVASGHWVGAVNAIIAKAKVASLFGEPADTRRPLEGLDDERLLEITAEYASQCGLVLSRDGNGVEAAAKPAEIVSALPEAAGVPRNGGGAPGAHADGPQPNGKDHVRGG